MEHTTLSASDHTRDVVAAGPPRSARQRPGARRERRRATLAGGVLATVVLATTACSSDGTSSDDADAASALVDSSTASSDDHVETATAFWEALEADDRELALSLVDPAYLDSGAGDPFGRARTLEQQFDWYEAVGWQWQFENCVPNDAVSAKCTATASNAWSDALEVDPVTGTFVIRFTDDGIRYVDEQTRSFSSQWVPSVFFEFEEWVETNFPADAETMFNFGIDVNPEILAMYETNTQRFVEAQERS